MWLILTVGIFLLSQWLYVKIKKSFLLPVFTTTIVIILLLLSTGHTYKHYYETAQWIDWLLGPAVVALSYPLYKHRKMLLKNGVKIISWVVVATAISILTGAFIFWLFGVNDTYVVTAMLKNITAPVAIALAEIYGGIPALIAVLCTLAGMLGAVAGPPVFRLLNIKSSIAKGVAMGSTAHAIGTSRLLEDDDYAGAISTLSFLIVTLIMPVIVPILVYLMVN